MKNKKGVSMFGVVLKDRNNHKNFWMRFEDKGHFDDWHEKEGGKIYFEHIYAGISAVVAKKIYHAEEMRLKEVLLRIKEIQEIEKIDF